MEEGRSLKWGPCGQNKFGVGGDGNICIGHAYGVSTRRCQVGLFSSSPCHSFHCFKTRGKDISHLGIRRKCFLGREKQGKAQGRAHLDVSQE